MKLSKTMLSIITLSIFYSISGCSINNIDGADSPTAVYVSNNENNSDIAALSPELSESQELDKRVAAVILDNNKDSYASGECQGEGHIILGTDNDNKIVYALTMYGEYGFQDGNFVKISGTGVIPVRITFDDNGNLTEYKMPSDGSYYIKSIEEMFPKKYHSLAVNPDIHNDVLKEQEVKYAEKYLKEINRSAKIGDYGDFEHTLLTDIGISVEVSNMLSVEKNTYQYPFWLGNQEFIENGKRYVYSMNYENDIISYTKTEYESGKIIELIQFDAKTGKKL